MAQMKACIILMIDEESGPILRKGIPLLKRLGKGKTWATQGIVDTKELKNHTGRICNALKLKILHAKSGTL